MENVSTPAERLLAGYATDGVVSYADAAHLLNSVTAERDALAAVIEQARMRIDDNGGRWLAALKDTHAILSTAPATVLAQVKADALRAEADRLEALIPASGFGGRQSGYGQAGLDLLSQVRREADRIERESQS